MFETALLKKHTPARMHSTDWIVRLGGVVEKHRLDFALINKVNDHIAEIIIDKDIVLTIEKTEELEIFLCAFFNSDFGLLMNKINHYSYTLEAQLSLCSREQMKAIATVFYNEKGSKTTQDIVRLRANDKLNVKEFSGLELGRQHALLWLESALINED